MVLDPVQVAGDTGEGSWQLLLATGRRAEGGQTDLLLAVLEHQWAARVTVAGGNGGWGGHTDVGGTDGQTIGLPASVVRDDSHVGVLQMSGNRAGGVGGAAPAGGNDLIVNISGVVGLQTGQLNGTDGVAEVGVWNANEGNVVRESLGVPAGMDDDVVLADAVLNLGARADGAAQMNIDGIDTGQIDKETKD